MCVIFKIWTNFSLRRSLDLIQIVVKPSAANSEHQWFSPRPLQSARWHWTPESPWRQSHGCVLINWLAGGSLDGGLCHQCMFCHGKWCMIDDCVWFNDHRVDYESFIIRQEVRRSVSKEQRRTRFHTSCPGKVGEKGISCAVVTQRRQKGISPHIFHLHSPRPP